MAAIWKAAYTTPDVLVGYVYFSAADARSMKPKDIKAAISNAKKRAKQKLAKQGVKVVRITALNCVG